MSLVIAFLTVVDLEFLRAIRYQATHMPDEKHDIHWFSSDKDSKKIIEEKWKTKYTDEKIMKLADALEDNEIARKRRNAELNE
jgi:hypothetical protein